MPIRADNAAPSSGAPLPPRFWTPSKVAFARLAGLLVFFQMVAWQERLLDAGALTPAWGVVATVSLGLALAGCFLGLRHAGPLSEARTDGRGRFWLGVALLALATFILSRAAHQIGKDFWRYPIGSYVADMLPLARNALREF